MYYLLLTLIIVASILLVLIVLIQNPKGGGLASGFAGTNNLMGVQRTGDILEKGTWILVITIMVCSLLINIVGAGPSSGNQGRELQQQITPTTAPSSPLTPGTSSTEPATGTVAPSEADTSK
ncbi:preprotein translocase subunit SecG [Olivibacter sitiensis]|uniref:preprotein translocase subunit SecG n=1 Tax=Olivibacter sitiensis TaxID=376470 RepID=UPI000403C945|nr:preprotein translocase subunit SecG [Olivibacter sitiensis]